MSCLSHASYLQHLVDTFASLLEARPKTRRRLLGLQDEVLALALLDLGPIAGYLQAHYTSNAGGKKSREPICMVRSMVLMSMRSYTSFDDWVEHLRTHPEEAILTGFDPDDLPGVGTYYHFLDRLRDGPVDGRFEDAVAPSEQTAGHGQSFIRHLEADQKEGQPQSEHASSSAGKVQQRVQGALERLDNEVGLPEDFLHRMERLLIETAVVPSMQRGLFGDPGELLVALDGSALPSQARGHGHAICDCEDRCDCARRFSDPTAQWGWNSHEERFYFGHRLHGHVLPTELGPDLPIHLSTTPANVPDVVRAVEDDLRLHVLLAEYLPKASIRYAPRDKGYDATWYYKLLMALDQDPVVALNHEVDSALESRDEIRLDDDGTPLCPEDVPMRRLTFDRDAQKEVFHCPAMRGADREFDPEACPLGEPCEPETKLGPYARLPAEDDPRYHGPIPRDGDRWDALYDQRSSAERFFSTAKETHDLGGGPFRRDYRYLAQATFLGIGEHARAWVRQRWGDDEVEDVDELMGRLEEVLADQRADDAPLDEAA